MVCLIAILCRCKCRVLVAVRRTGGRGDGGGSECRASNDQLEYTERYSSSCVEFSLGLTLPVKNFHDTTTTSRRSALCRRIYVSAFALVVYWYDPNGAPIAIYQIPRLHYVEVQRPIFEALPL